MALWEKLLSSNIFGTVSALFDNTGKVIGLRVNNRDVVDDLGISSDLESKMPKQPTAVNNNVAKFNGHGEVIDSGVSAASLGMIDGESDTYALLPAANEHNGEVWLVKTTTGVIYVNRKVAGLYVSNGTAWTLITPVDVDGYQKLIVSPTTDNILKTDSNGQAQDSVFSLLS